MSKSVWKYILEPGVTTLVLPVDAMVLSVYSQGREVCLWALVDTSEPIQRGVNAESRTFVALATGEVAPRGSILTFISTVLINGGALVFHIFEVTQQEQKP